MPDACVATVTVEYRRGHRRSISTPDRREPCSRRRCSAAAPIARPDRRVPDSARIRSARARPDVHRPRAETSRRPSSIRSRRAAATYGDGPLLIIAGAGTGKTRTLVYRVAHLIERGVDAGAHPPAHVHAPRRAGDARARRATRRAARARACTAAPSTRPAHRLLRRFGAAAGLAERLHDHGPGRRRGPDAARPRAARATASRTKRFPKKETLHYVYSRHVNTEIPVEDDPARRVPAVRRVRAATSCASSPTTRAEGRSAISSTTTTCCSSGR